MLWLKNKVAKKSVRTRLLSSFSLLENSGKSYAKILPWQRNNVQSTTLMAGVSHHERGGQIFSSRIPRVPLDPPIPALNPRVSSITPHLHDKHFPLKP